MLFVERVLQPVLGDVQLLRFDPRHRVLQAVLRRVSQVLLAVSLMASALGVGDYFPTNSGNAAHMNAECVSPLSFAFSNAVSLACRSASPWESFASGIVYFV